jgi:eukaryotic-like serine/threonine-protein kinase
VWVDREGKEEALKFSPAIYRNPRISPEGKRIALAILKGGAQNIWTYDIDGGIKTRITSGATMDTGPLWTPNGQRIIFSSNRGGRGSIYSIAADGTGKIEQLGSLTNQINWHANSWADKGNTLIIAYPGNNIDIGALSMEGDRRLKPLLHEKYNELLATISPNGRWIAYESDESNLYEVYVRPYPEVDKTRRHVSNGGGNMPLWSPDGRELFYRNGESVMALPVEAEPNFSYKTAKVLFRKPYVSSFTQEEGMVWDIHPKDKRFLMMKDAESNASASEGLRKINIVLNWFEDLKQRAPAK